MFWIEKDIRFEAAHRLLPPYEGKCRNLHGHSYLVKVRLGSENLNECGFVADFQDLKPVERWIDENFDHTVLIHEADQDLLSYLEKTNQRTYLFPGNPSSEMIAAKILELVSERFSHLNIEIEINETCKSRVILRDNNA